MSTIASYQGVVKEGVIQLATDANLPKYFALKPYSWAASGREIRRFLSSGFCGASDMSTLYEELGNRSWRLLAHEQNWGLLTRDQGLLQRNLIIHGYYRAAWITGSRSMVSSIVFNPLHAMPNKVYNEAV